jgi:serine/threonine protein kinase
MLSYLLSGEYHLGEVQEFEKFENRFRCIEDNLEPKKYKFSTFYLSMIKKCLCEDPKDRISISELLDQFQSTNREFNKTNRIGVSRRNRSPSKVKPSEIDRKKGRRRSDSFIGVSYTVVESEKIIPKHLSSVHEWLKSNDFLEYEITFLKLGFDDLIVFPELSFDELYSLGIPISKIDEFESSLVNLKKEIPLYLKKELNLESIDCCLKSMNGMEMYKDSFKSFENVEKVISFVQTASKQDFQSIGILLPGHMKKFQTIVNKTK